MAKGELQNIEAKLLQPISEAVRQAKTLATQTMACDDDLDQPMLDADDAYQPREPDFNSDEEYDDKGDLAEGDTGRDKRRAKNADARNRAVQQRQAKLPRQAAAQSVAEATRENARASTERG
eukprot:TRINITY_DN92669_c0_g1_i1.p2 TRINITY_DN92669_c0_g1~~TRINITY_DN92669_c0_g1_i1.p2  ORF type:complete len:122 (+),score=28.01 TRINITY_DN92669_c0_g1_i1:261-626(+)